MTNYVIILILSLAVIILLLVIRQLKHNEGITKDWLWSIRATHDDAIKCLEHQNVNLKWKLESCKAFIAYCNLKSPQVISQLSKEFEARKEL